MILAMLMILVGVLMMVHPFMQRGQPMDEAMRNIGRALLSVYRPVLPSDEMARIVEHVGEE